MAQVLVVDDSFELCKVLVRLLRSAGFDAVFAEDGWAALEAVRTATPDLIVLDVMMPDLDGYAVLAALREDPRTATIPVVMYSALDDAASRERAKALGAQEYLVKGMANFGQLEAAVRRFVASSAGGESAAPSPHRGPPPQNLFHQHSPLPFGQKESVDCT